MESRRIYLEVATLLRGNSAPPIDPFEYRHSRVALDIRRDVVESMLLYESGLAYMAAFASLHAHPQADIEKGSDQINKMYFDALGKVPYLTGGQSGEDIVMGDRMKAVEEYLKMKRAMIKVK